MNKDSGPLVEFPFEALRLRMDEDLSGGVSCDVRFGEHAGKSVVVKTALPKLRVSADWRADPGRVAVEVRALRLARELLGADVVPAVVWFDEASHTFAMERIEAHASFKQQLLAGVVDPVPPAARAGQLLAQLHEASSRHAELAAFDDTSHFHALRIVPFFRRVAEKNPELAARIERLVTDMAAHRSALVHGDYSPKNLLVQDAHVVVLDWEVAHRGDPAFDVAFFVHHLWLKTWLRSTRAAELVRAAREFLAAYARGHAAPNEEHAVRLTAALGLARLEGDSPVDYRDRLPRVDTKAALVQILCTPSPSWTLLFDLAATGVVDD